MSVYRVIEVIGTSESGWEAATKDYHRISVPVLLIWGDQDWARPFEREHDHTLIPAAGAVAVERGGHFLPLDRPDAVTRHLLEFPQFGRA